VEAPAASRPTLRIVPAHNAQVASFEADRAAREITHAKARSRSRRAGPSRAGRPDCLAIARTVATSPCGSERALAGPSPATISALPADTAQTASITGPGSAEMLAADLPVLAERMA